MGVDENGKLYIWGYTKITDKIDIKDIPDEVKAAKLEMIAAGADHAVALAIVEALGHPLVTASVKDSEEEYTTDPSLIEERYGSAVEAVIDGGYGLCVPTTVVDCTDESDIVVLREGIGELV